MFPSKQEEYRGYSFLVGPTISLSLSLSLYIYIYIYIYIFYLSHLNHVITSFLFHLHLFECWCFKTTKHVCQTRKKKHGIHIYDSSTVDENIIKYWH